MHNAWAAILQFDISARLLVDARKAKSATANDGARGEKVN